MKIILNEIGTEGRFLDDNGKEMDIGVEKIEFEPIMPGKLTKVRLTVDYVAIEMDCNCNEVEFVKKDK